jgi:hypothetical protein
MKILTHVSVGWKYHKKLEGTKTGIPFLFPQVSTRSMVGATGFEPATSWSQTTRATNCATPRLLSGDRVSTVISAAVQHDFGGGWKKIGIEWRKRQ